MQNALIEVSIKFYFNDAIEGGPYILLRCMVQQITESKRDGRVCLLWNVLYIFVAYVFQFHKQ